MDLQLQIVTIYLSFLFRCRIFLIFIKRDNTFICWECILLLDCSLFQPMCILCGVAFTKNKHVRTFGSIDVSSMLLLYTVLYCYFSYQLAIDGWAKETVKKVAVTVVIILHGEPQSEYHHIWASKIMILWVFCAWLFYLTLSTVVHGTIYIFTEA
jgi:hypothetical protein